MENIEEELNILGEDFEIIKEKIKEAKRKIDVLKAIKILREEE